MTSMATPSGHLNVPGSLRNLRSSPLRPNAGASIVMEGMEQVSNGLSQSSAASVVDDDGAGPLTDYGALTTMSWKESKGAHDRSAVESHDFQPSDMEDAPLEVLEL
jgi:hypothetical protein